jgi:hypothetical protein
VRVRLELWTKEQGGRHVEPADVSAWAAVSTGLVLGVLEGDQQVGTATVLGP